MGASKETKEAGQLIMKWCSRADLTLVCNPGRFMPPLMISFASPLWELALAQSLLERRYSYWSSDQRRAFWSRLWPLQVFNLLLFLNRSTLSVSPRVASLDATRWQTSPPTKCTPWRWSHRAGCPNRTRGTRYTAELVCVLHRGPSTTLDPIPGLCFEDAYWLSHFCFFPLLTNRSRMRSSSTKPCRTSMWWNSHITLKTKKTSTYSSSSAVGRWEISRAVFTAAGLTRDDIDLNMQTQQP